MAKIRQCCSLLWDYMPECEKSMEYSNLRDWPQFAIEFFHFYLLVLLIKVAIHNHMSQCNNLNGSSSHFWFYSWIHLKLWITAFNIEHGWNMQIVIIALIINHSETETEFNKLNKKVGDDGKSELFFILNKIHINDRLLQNWQHVHLQTKQPGEQSHSDTYHTINGELITIAWYRYVYSNEMLVCLS